MDKDIFMLCESITESEIAGLKGEWLSNRKEDGERIMSVVKDGEVFLLNRRGILKNKQFREIEEELKILPNCVIDGEVVSQDGDFGKTQSRAGTQNKFKIAELEKTIPLYFMVFDIIQLNGVDLRNTQLKDRIIKLNELFNSYTFKDIKICEYKPIAEMLEQAKEKGWEGIVIKDLNGIYESKRSNLWLKLKLKIERVVNFNIYEVNNKGLRLSDEKDNAVQMSQLDLVKIIKKEIDENGFIKCEVECMEIFDSGKMRQPVFKRIFED